MTGVFDDFIPALPEILDEINALKSKRLSLHETVVQISDSIYSNSNLHVLIAWIIRGESLDALSSFSKDSNQLEIFREHHSKRSIELNPPQTITDHVISSNSPHFYTDVERYDKIFWSTIFNLTSSEIYLPLRKSGRVIGVLQMGSDDIVEFSALSNVKDDIVVQSDLKMIQLLIERLNEALNSAQD